MATSSPPPFPARARWSSPMPRIWCLTKRRSRWCVSSSSNSGRKFAPPDLRRVPWRCEKNPGKRRGLAAMTASLDPPDVLQRQLAHGVAGRGMDRIEYGGCHHADRRFADATPEIVARYDDRLDLRHFGKPHDRIAVEVQI